MRSVCGPRQSESGGWNRVVRTYLLHRMTTTVVNAAKTTNPPNTDRAMMPPERHQWTDDVFIREDETNEQRPI